MNVLRSLLIALMLVPATGRAAEDPWVSTFAACAGRFSAELEHAWLMHSDSTEEIAQRRQQFLDILAAAVPTDRLGDTLHLRIDAKLAHAQLLTQATFSQDEMYATWAVRRAQEQVAYCAQFLLES